MKINYNIAIKLSFIIVPYILFCAFLPILKSGYFSDDIVNSLIPGTIKNLQSNVGAYIVSEMQAWNFRFFPLSIFSTIIIFNYFKTALSYQVVRSLFIFINLLSFAWLIKLMTHKIEHAVLFLLLLPLCWSMRVGSDPLTSFAIFLPLLGIFTAWSMIAFIYYQNSQQMYWYATSIILFFASLATYEIGMINFFLILLLQIEYKKSYKEVLTNIKPYAILFFAYLLVTYYLHHNQKLIYDGILLGGFRLWGDAFFAQLSSALPLSYLFAKNCPLSFAELHHYLRSVLFFSSLFILAFVLFLQLIPNVKIKNDRNFFLLGLILLTFPAAIIASSLKYQAIVYLGDGYIPVYIQYLGTASLLLSLCNAINKFAANHKWLHGLLALIFSLCLVLSVACNWQIVLYKNQLYYNHRSIMENALRRNILAMVPQDSMLITKIRLWNNANFYALHNKFRLQRVSDINDFSKLTMDNVKKNNFFYIQVMQHNREKSGIVLLGRIRDFKTVNAAKNLKLLNYVTLDQIRIYVQVDHFHEIADLLKILKQNLKLNKVDAEKIVQQVTHQDTKKRQTIDLSLAAQPLKINYLEEF